MTIRTESWQRGRVGLLVVLAWVTCTLATVASAQSRSTMDAEPPLIEHEVQAELDDGAVQSFEATVVDDEELDTVRLFYRYAGEQNYTAQLMNRVSTSALYRIRIPIEAGNRRDLEYYIEAQDVSGNRTFRGFTFNPLVRRAAVSGVASGATGSTSDEPEVRSGNRRIWYYVLGALAVGTVAALASSSDGGGDGGGGGAADDDCPGSTCELTLTVEEPF